MFKQLTVCVLLFMVISCGQKKSSSDTTAAKANDSIAAKTQEQIIPADLPDTGMKRSDASLPGLTQFIQQGYTILDTASGDLNLDQYPDMILILKKNGEDTTSDVVDHPGKRPLLILIKQADNSYKLAAQNNNAVLCVDCGGTMGDPYSGITIRKGYFSVEHYGGSSWRWTRIVTFKYSDADKYWYLYKDGGDSFNTSDPDKVKTTVKTTKNFGKVPFDKFDIYKED